MIIDFVVNFNLFSDNIMISFHKFNIGILDKMYMHLIELFFITITVLRIL